MLEKKNQRCCLHCRAFRHPAETNTYIYRFITSDKAKGNELFLYQPIQSSRTGPSLTNSTGSELYEQITFVAKLHYQTVCYTESIILQMSKTLQNICIFIYLQCSRLTALHHKIRSNYFVVTIRQYWRYEIFCTFSNKWQTHSCKKL